MSRLQPVSPKFLDLVQGLAADSHNEPPVPLLNQTLQDWLLSFGSETEDNLSCVRNIGIGQFSDFRGEIRTGFVTRESGIPLSDILNAAEGCSIPEQLKTIYPQLNQEQWDATLRLATMLLLALEKKAS